MTAEARAWVNPHIKRIWDTSQHIYRTAEQGQMWLHQPGEREAASRPQNPPKLSQSARARLAGPDPDPESVRRGDIPPRNPKGYSTWFEMALDRVNWGAIQGVISNERMKLCTDIFRRIQNLRNC